MIYIKMTRIPNLSLNAQPSRAQWRDLGLRMRRMIIDRTMSGIDIHEKPFAKYSTAYQKRREALGKTVDVVNLQDRSEMLNSLDYKEDSSGVDVFYSERQRGLVALYHQNGDGSLPQREHFGFTTRQTEQIRDQIYAYIKQAARL